MALTADPTFEPSNNENNNNDCNTLKLTTIDKIGGIHCSICKLTVKNKKAFDDHYKIHNKDVVYTCVVCFKDIHSYATFRNHCYAHVMKAQFECNICEKKFSKLASLNKHHKNIHEKVYICPPPCKKIFKSSYELQIHSVVHQIKTSYDCEACKEKIDSLEMCMKHAEKHSVSQYFCPICDKPITETNAPEHLQTHFNGEPINVIEEEIDNTSDSCSIDIACSICDKTYYSKTEFDLHYKSVHDSNTIIYSCSVCWKDHNIYSAFRDHCYDHVITEQSCFKCDTCHKTFPRLALLVLHVEAQHSGASKPYACVQCGYMFCKDSTLKYHLQLAHGIQYLICSESSCGKMFESPRALVYHQIEHKNDSENRCSKCGLHFKNLLACYKHINLHKKKTLTCPICSRKYGEKQVLMKHSTQHFQATFHLCKCCDKMFTSRWRLAQHSKIHSSEGHECEYCGKKYRTRYTLQQHINTHTGSTPFKCTLCMKTFHTDPNWRKHMKKVHNVTVKTVKPTAHFKTKGSVNSAKAHATISEDETSVLKATDYNDSNSNSDLILDEKEPNTVEILNYFDTEPVGSLEVDKDESNSDLSLNLEPTLFDIAEEITPKNDMIEEITPENDITEEITPENDMIDLKHDHEDIHIETSLEIKQLLQGDAMILDENIETLYQGNDHTNDINRYTQQTTTSLPCEYGPDFVNDSTFDYGNQVINLDDPALPHIYPYLTINDAKRNIPTYETLTNVPVQTINENYQLNVNNTITYKPWEASINKIYENDISLLCQYWE